MNKVTILTAERFGGRPKPRTSRQQICEVLATRNLTAMSLSIQRDIEINIPVTFSDHLVLTLKHDPYSGAIKVDYSRVKDRTSARLIRLYITGNRKAFAQAWMKVA